MEKKLQDLLVTIPDAIETIRQGGVGIMAVDTVYGLVTRADNQEGVKRLYALKHREKKPGTIIAAGIEQLVELGVERSFLEKVDQWWPNSLSVIVPTGDNLFYLHQGLDSLPFRIPKDENIRALLKQTGPLATSSANHPGEPTSEQVEQAWNYFHDQVDFYVDGGDMSGRAPSTIIRINDNGSIEVLREGAVKIS